MSEVKYKIVSGSLEPRTFHKYENGRMVGYCYSIERNANGREIGRTEAIRLGSLGWDDGSDFTESDYNRIANGYEQQTIIDKFLAWLNRII